MRLSLRFTHSAAWRSLNSSSSASLANSGGRRTTWALDVAQILQAIEHVRLLGAHGLARRARDGAAAGHEQVRVVGRAVLLVELKRREKRLRSSGRYCSGPPKNAT